MTISYPKNDFVLKSCKFKRINLYFVSMFAFTINMNSQINCSAALDFWCCRVGFEYFFRLQNCVECIRFIFQEIFLAIDFEIVSVFRYAFELSSQQKVCRMIISLTFFDHVFDLLWKQIKVFEQIIKVLNNLNKMCLFRFCIKKKSMVLPAKG